MGLPACAIATYSAKVDTINGKPKDPYNTAVVEVLSARKDKPSEKVTFERLSELSGIKVRQLKYLLNDERQLHMGEFLSICTALKLDPADVVDEAMGKLAKAAE